SARRYGESALARSAWGLRLHRSVRGLLHRHSSLGQHGGYTRMRGQESMRGRGASFAVMGTVLVGIVIVAILGVLVMPYALGGSDRRDTRLVIPIDARTFPDAAWRSFVLS